MVTSNAAWSLAHAEMAGHVAGLHHSGSLADEASSDHRQHAKKEHHAAKTAPEPEIGSLGKHHNGVATEGCCAVACAGALLLPGIPELIPTEILSIRHPLAADAIHAADPAPKHRPPRNLELVG